MDKPTISFIIPIYNVECFLEQCLKSVLEQSITKEIIIIDDGSTDNSLTIALDYAKQYPNILIVHTTNQGAGAARNIGLKLAKGEYISFIDGDDYLVGDVSQLVREGKQHNANLIRFRAILFEQDSPNPYREYAEILEKGQLITGYNVFKTMYESNYWIPGVCWTLMKKSYLDEYQLTFQEGTIAEDQLFYIKLLTSAPNCLLINLPDVHYIYRQNNHSSVSKRRDTNYIDDHLRIISSIWQYLATQPKEIQNYIFYVTQKILWTVVEIIQEWDITQRQQFLHFYEEGWRKLLKEYYPMHWKYIKQLYNITE